MKKKILALILCAALALSLAGCGKSANVKAAEEQIAALGEITVDSKAAVEAAEAAYAALTEKEKEKVENLPALTEAREALDSALRVRDVEDRISALGEITIDSKAVVEAAEAALDALIEGERSLVGNAADLTAAREALDAALELEAKRQALLGAWIWTVDASDLILGELENSLEGVELDPSAYPMEFLMDVTMELREDDTYAMYISEESLRSAVDSIRPGLMSLIRDMISQMIVQQFANAGLGTYNSLEDLENAMGMSLDEMMEAAMGTSLDELFDEMLNESLGEDTLSEMSAEGNYQADVAEGKLYFSEKLEEEVSADNCEMYRLEGDTLEIIGHMGTGMFENFYPVTMHRAG